MIVREDSNAQTLRRRFAALRAAAAGPIPSLHDRQSHLAAIERGLKAATSDLISAICADFGNRSAHETRLLEILPTLEAARHARRHVGRWMAPQRRHVAIHFRPAGARVIWQPVGVVGIIAPWNYPVLLALGPLVGALAAGNRVMIKLSEQAPRTAAAIARLLDGLFPDDRVRVETGGVQTGRAFAALPFDHLLFTGSSATGQSVMRAAATNLTPLTLELGGKSPVIVGADAGFATAAARILSGKCRNAGQTCVAPDYLLLPHGSVDAFAAEARRIVTARYPSLAANPDYTSIISDEHFDRLLGLIADAQAKGATRIPLHAHDSKPDKATRMFPPSLLIDVDDSMRIMREEIFGPLLPVRTYRTLAEAIAYVNARPRPLALSYFGRNAADIETVLRETISGGACINDVILQFAQNELPFGGIGASGFGAYHGRDGFERLSHKKAVFVQADVAATSLLEPPYGKRFETLARLLIR